MYFANNLQKLIYEISNVSLHFHGALRYCLQTQTEAPTELFDIISRTTKVWNKHTKRHLCVARKISILKKINQNICVSRHFGSLSNSPQSTRPHTFDHFNHYHPAHRTVWDTFGVRLAEVDFAKGVETSGHEYLIFFHNICFSLCELSLTL